MSKRRKKQSSEQSDKKASSHASRPFWSGTISFGLVNVPVHLFPANRQGGVSFRLLDEDGTPLARRYYCPQHQRDIHPEHILRGYQLEDDQYVIVRDKELEAAEPRKTREIDLRHFVEIADISPMLYERSYYLTPAGDSNKAYRLLAEAMHDSGLAGMGTFVMRDREYVVAVLEEEGILHAQTLRFADELRSPEDVGLHEIEKVVQKEASRLGRIIKEATSPQLDRNILRDDYAQRVKRLAEERRKQRQGVVHLAEADSPSSGGGAESPDLLETIRRSLQQGDNARSRPPSKSHHRDDKRRLRTAENLEEESKEQLYERAKQLDIPGRSKLSKRELARAISRASSRS